MNSRFLRAREKLSQDGVGPFLKSLFSFARRILRRKVFWKARNAYSINRGFEELDICSNTFVFYARDEGQLNNVRFAIESEEKILRDLVNELNSSDVFYDIGAAQGVYSIVVAHIVGSVIAFEPVPTHTDIINRNISLNDKSDVIDAYSFVISDSSGERKAGELGVGMDDDEVVPAKSIDELLASGATPPPTVMKIDVEGHERSVIEGMGRTLENEDLRVIYCELHQPTGDSLDDTYLDGIIETLNTNGFEISLLQERGAETHIKATR